MNILVTGGTGFIGSNLCRELVKQGHQVFCLDNNYTGSLDNVQELMDKSEFCFIEHDICNRLDSIEKLQGVKLDRITILPVLLALQPIRVSTHLIPLRPVFMVLLTCLILRSNMML